MMRLFQMKVKLLSSTSVEVNCLQSPFESRVKTHFQVKLSLPEKVSGLHKEFKREYIINLFLSVFSILNYISLTEVFFIFIFSYSRNLRSYKVCARPSGNKII